MSSWTSTYPGDFCQSWSSGRKSTRVTPFESLGPDDTFLETPYGRLYRPLSQGRQVLVMIACFFASVGLGWLIAAIAGDLSELAQALVTAPFMLVFFFGYSAWMARTAAIATRHFGWPLLKTFWSLILRRRTPGGVEEVFPSRETMLEMAVKAQAAGVAFRTVSYPLAAIFGLLATQVESQMGGAVIALIVAVGTVGWGVLLALLARTGWLPMAEE